MGKGQNYKNQNVESQKEHWKFEKDQNVENQNDDNYLWRSTYGYQGLWEG